MTDRKKRVLFVDDESHVVQGLQRLLRPLRAAWEVSTATSAAQALEIMATLEVDVVVSDMRMPQVDGAKFLAVVKERHPATMRMVLSGQTDKEAALRAVRVAHQFLSKPTEPSVLIEQIQRLSAIHEMIQDPAQRVALGGVETLPSASETLLALDALLAAEAPELDAITGVVEAEPAVAMKLLQLVNSAFFGLRRPIVDIGEAVAFLGADLVRGLVRSVGIVDDQPTPSVRFDMQTFRAHAGDVARMTRVIDPTGERAQVAFTAALLHDIGHLFMASCLPARFDDVAAGAERAGTSFEEEEHRRGGCVHENMGAALLEMWGLPSVIGRTIATFESAPTSVGTELRAADVVHLAHRLVAPVGHDLASEEDRAYVARLGVAERLDAWKVQAAQIRAA